ncbi:S8 family peptidase [Spirosoma validum]|uniref:S8 family serine peptidase n=1 Tax=Spirosoma validum TaxID=2771355 RepID=A0A927AZ07_9BACT|nr:S8 family serine peptidase [Spirosoma validum]MBD2752343.1 S8 family serine peptidase [Spirosoma validum]
MFNHLRSTYSIAVLIGLLLSIPFLSVGQADLKQEAKAAKLSPDLLTLQLEAAQQKTLGQQSSKLRQAAPSTNSTPSGFRFGKFPIDRSTNRNTQQPLLKENQLKSGNLRQAAVSEGTITSMKSNRTRIRDGRVAIDAVANEADGQALLNDLQALGLQDGRYYQHIVFGYFPIDKLNRLRNVTTLRIARPSYRPIAHAGKVTSQGDKVMQADIARQTYNVTGAGSKIGVLSDSYNALGGAADGVASGDLPANVQILKDLPLDADSFLIDEGRAMAEIVHDVAPGADIAFYTAFESQVDFALGIIDLAKAGCNIIVDDVYYADEPFFQDGIIAQAVDYVKKSFNVSYFSAAGNQARDSYTSGFRNSGKLPPLPAGFSFPGGASAHEFGNGSIVQKIILQPGGIFTYNLQWADPFYSQSALSGGVSGAKTDLGVYVYIGGVLRPDLSSDEANIGLDPFEFNSIYNGSQTPAELEVVVVKYAGPDPSLLKFMYYGFGSTIQYLTQSSTVVGHANAAGAIAVGATWYRETPAYDPVQYPLPLIDYFSSAGGTPILFTPYGQPIPPQTRLKPEIVAPNGANTTFFFPGVDYENDGFPNFDGTSAAAPHAAGVAALLQEKARNSMSPDNVLLRLRTTAIDMDDPYTPGFDTGFDFGTGFGLIQADKALMIDGQPLVVLEPLYDCQTGAITLRTSGGDGTPITFTAPGIIRSSPASTSGVIEAGLRNDPKPILITAEQNGIKAVYEFSFAAYCNSERARIGATEPGTGLQITTLGNPINTDWVDVEVRGVQGQSLKLQVNNTLGESSSQRAVEIVAPVERHRLMLGHSAGMYFIHVSTPTQTKILKVVRQ